jgi:hypothetical protein
MGEHRKLRLMRRGWRVDQRLIWVLRRFRKRFLLLNRSYLSQTLHSLLLELGIRSLHHFLLRKHPSLHCRKIQSLLLQTRSSLNFPLLRTPQ